MKCTICNGDLIELTKECRKDFLHCNIDNFVFINTNICAKYNCLTNISLRHEHNPNFLISFNNYIYMFLWKHKTESCEILKYSNYNGSSYWYFTPVRKIDMPIQHISQDKAEMIFNFR